MKRDRCSGARTHLLAFTVLALSIGCPVLSFAASYQYSDFSGGLGSDFQFIDDQNVFTLSTGSSGLRLTKGDGTGSGFTQAEIVWNLLLVGDFTADVDYELKQPLADGQQLEWHLDSPSGPYFFLVRSNESWILGGNNYHVWNGLMHGDVPTTDGSGTLRIVRAGTEVNAYFKSPGGSTFTHVFGESFPTEDLYLSMTLQNQPLTTSSLDASFSNIRISDSSPVPLPQAWLLLGSALAAVGYRRRRYS